MASRAKKLWKSRDESGKTKIYRRDAEYPEKFKEDNFDLVRWIGDGSRTR